MIFCGDGGVRPKFGYNMLSEIAPGSLKKGGSHDMKNLYRGDNCQLCF